MLTIAPNNCIVRELSTIILLVDIFTELKYTDSEGIIEFNVEELEGYMDMFSERKIIGRGGFGPVYAGIIKKRPGINVKELHVAIKSSRNKDAKATEQWLAEKEYLPEVKHQNIIKLIGYCEAKDKFYLVYPYMQNQTVFTHLSGYPPIYSTRYQS
uniref:Protein kinase domain-containing protein n=1 Tax=Manihot esculenta TaxID=3983 RepID=A0A2C9V6D9_MANES